MAPGTGKKKGNTRTDRLVNQTETDYSVRTERCFSGQVKGFQSAVFCRCLLLNFVEMNKM